MLKKISLILTLAIGGFVMTAHADSVSLYSDATTTTNNSADPTIDIDPNPAWAPALPGSSWVSFMQTGNPGDAGFVVVPNGTDVTFTQTFMLTELGGLSGSLTVLADDTTSVIINGVTVYPANLGGSYPTCSSAPIGCLTSTEEVLDLSAFASDFQVGINTISFQVFQENAVSYGLDYSGTLNTSVPEPGSLGLLASGLMGLFLVGRRKVFSL